jgi:hypothetical protein
MEEYDNALPALVLHIQYLKQYTAWMLSTEDEDSKARLEFIVGQLLRIVKDRDFSDEVGRRELQSFLSRSSFIFNV